MQIVLFKLYLYNCFVLMVVVQIRCNLYFLLLYFVVYFWIII
jgi:hypothetical protein